MVPPPPDSVPVRPPSPVRAAAVPLARDAAGPPRPVGEAELIRRAQSGDEAAFRQLYDATIGQVFALCLRMTADRRRAREFTHDVYVRAWERLSGFRGDAAFGSWLHRIAVNIVLTDERGAKRRRARIGLADDEGVEEESVAGAGSSDDPGTRVDLERAIALLPPRARRVFVLHDVMGYQHAEVAELMSLAEATVRVHLHHARRMLMERLSR